MRKVENWKSCDNSKRTAGGGETVSSLHLKILNIEEVQFLAVTINQRRNNAGAVCSMQPLLGHVVFMPFCGLGLLFSFWGCFYFWPVFLFGLLLIFWVVFTLFFLIKNQ